MAWPYRKPWVGGSWAPWLRALRGKRGVYVVKELGWLSDSVVYVGESHGNKRSGDLYTTITRHFQSWSGETAGTRYDRDGVEVAAVVVRDREAAFDLQRLMIERLRPRDNRQSLPGGGDDDGWTPF